MSKPLQKKITIFLSLEPNILQGYFNPQDPSPIYKRQLSHEFEQYIMTCIRSAKRDTVFNFKISYRNEDDKDYAEPLAFAIRRHFADARVIMNATFEKFKKRTYILLFVSLSMVTICQGFVPLLFQGHGEHSFQSGLINSMDVLCWVILWKPIDRLIFYWNPFLKDISIFTRLEKAEVTTMEIES